MSKLKDSRRFKTLIQSEKRNMSSFRKRFSRRMSSDQVIKLDELCKRHSQTTNTRGQDVLSAALELAGSHSSKRVRHSHRGLALIEQQEALATPQTPMDALRWSRSLSAAVAMRNPELTLRCYPFKDISDHDSLRRDSTCTSRSGSINSNLCSITGSINPSMSHRDDSSE